LSSAGKLLKSRIKSVVTLQVYNTIQLACFLNKK